MKIDGIDPLLLNRIQEQALRSQVDETERPQTENRVDRRESTLGERPQVLDEEALKEEVKEAVDKFNDAVQAFDKGLEFRLHEEADRWMVEVWDLEEDEIIKEIPPEKILNVIAQIQSLIGVLLDEKR